MPPEESTNRPDPGRQPYPRRRIAVDGVSRSDYIGRRPPTSPAPRPVQVPTPQHELPTAETAPQAASPVPDPILESVPVPAAQPALATPTPPPAPTVPVAPLDFTPPPKQKKRFFKLKLPRIQRSQLRVTRKIMGILVVLAVLIVAAGLVLWRSGQQAPSDSVLRQALEQSLSTKQLHASFSGSEQIAVEYDFTNASDPTISTAATIQLSGDPVKVSGYGNTKNTYISYSLLPSSVPPALSGKLTGNWVQLRANGVASPGVPAQLSRASDPRFRAFGPLLFGNLSPAARKQLVDYVLAHAVYDYSGTKPATDKLGDQKVVRYDVAPNVSQLKVINQSLATAMSIDSNAIQDAVAKLDELKGTNLRIYIATKSHQIVRLEVVKNNQTTTIDYSGYNTTTLPAEPQTKLTWQSFAPTQYQLATQIAAKQSPSQLDGLRKQQLDTVHKIFRAYYAQAGSYPSLSNINDPAWISANLPGLDPDMLRDPLAASQVVLVSPKPATIAYQAVAQGGVGVCENTAENPCVHYKLVTILSNNQQYSVQDP